MSSFLVCRKGVFIKFLFFLFFIFSSGSIVFAASGSPNAQGGILYVDGQRGIIGWGQEPDGRPIRVDVYVCPAGKGAPEAVCSAGEIETVKYVDEVFEGYSKVKSHNGRLFVFNPGCFRQLPDGSYDVWLALGPNYFAPGGAFRFVVTTLTPASDLRIWMHYLGVLVNRVNNNYDSYPTVMFEGGKYRMWYASGNLTGHPGDNIFYAESNDGINWSLINGPLEGGAVLMQTINNCTCTEDPQHPGSCPPGEDFAFDDMHVADPTVVKVGDTYYLYYTAASKKWACFGANNHIALAVSRDGINWEKKGVVIAPVNPCTSIDTCGPWVQGYPHWYGAGMPSIIYLQGEGKFVNFFTDMSLDNYAWSVGESVDGFNFQRQNSISSHAGFDVKYFSKLNRYVAITSPITNENVPGFVLMKLSDRISSGWQDVGFDCNNAGYPSKAIFTMDQFTNDTYHWNLNNPGLLGDAHGKVDGRYTIIYSGAGLAMQPKEYTWDIIGIEAWVSKKANGEDYRRLLEKYGSAACGDEFDIDINCKVNTIDFWLR